MVACLPLVAVCSTVLIGFAALAVDVGRLAVAKVQCQNAADAAAIAGARTLDGRNNPDLSGASANATNTATDHKVLSQSISQAEVSVQHGAYHYDFDSQLFVPQFPPVSPDNYNLTQVTITHQVSGTFCQIFGAAFTTITATATAAHRPRDVAIVLDYSGSMNNESDLWNNEGYLGTATNSPNNPDPVFPQFGPYAPTFSPRATLQCTSNDPRVGKCNITQAVLGIPPMVNDFYQNAFGGSETLGLHPRLERVQCSHGRRQLSQCQWQVGSHLDRCRQSQHVVLSRLYRLPRVYAGARVLGEDVLHLAPAAEQRLAEAVLPAYGRDAVEQ